MADTPRLSDEDLTMELLRSRVLPPDLFQPILEALRCARLEGRREGAEAMRERAAKVADACMAQAYGRPIAKRIRALDPSLPETPEP